MVASTGETASTAAVAREKAVKRARVAPWEAAAASRAAAAALVAAATSVVRVAQPVVDGAKGTLVGDPEVQAADWEAGWRAAALVALVVRAARTLR